MFKRNIKRDEKTPSKTFPHLVVSTLLSLLLFMQIFVDNLFAALKRQVSYTGYFKLNVEFNLYWFHDSWNNKSSTPDRSINEIVLNLSLSSLVYSVMLVQKRLNYKKYPLASIVKLTNNWHLFVGVQACAYPGTAISGRMSSVKFYYQINETVTFTCDDGLVMQGASMLKCQHNGKWSNAVPTCGSQRAPSS